MKNIILLNRFKYFQIFLILSISVVLFCSFTVKGIQFNLNNEQIILRDTVPGKELNNINWSNVKRMVASNGALIASLKTNETLIIARKDYEIFASENGKISESKYNEIFSKVEIEPEYPGGADAWSAYLKNNMHYPKEAINGNINGTVIVQLVVDQEGNVQDAECIDGPVTGGLREEALRLVQASGKWHPAIQNFRIVKAYKKQPVPFNRESQQQKFNQVVSTSDSSSNITESEYPGGKQGWMMYLMQHLRYPLSAMNNNIQGTVIVKFIINEKGRLKQLDAISGPKELRQEAIRVIQESGRWMPAKENGKPIKSEREQAITFKREFPAS
jgi:TonB family protein